MSFVLCCIERPLQIHCSCQMYAHILSVYKSGKSFCLVQVITTKRVLIYQKAWWEKTPPSGTSSIGLRKIKVGEGMQIHIWKVSLMSPTKIIVSKAP